MEDKMLNLSELLELLERMTLAIMAAVYFLGMLMGKVAIFILGA
jgi:hypothetical protein